MTHWYENWPPFVISRVANNQDPLRMGRVKTDQGEWAEPLCSEGHSFIPSIGTELVLHRCEGKIYYTGAMC